MKKIIMFNGITIKGKKQDSLGTIFFRFANLTSKENMDFTVSELAVPKNHVIELTVKRNYERKL